MKVTRKTLLFQKNIRRSAQLAPIDVALCSFIFLRQYIRSNYK